MNQGTARVLTAAIGIPFVLGSIWLGGWAFFGFIAIVVLGGVWEMSSMMKHAGRQTAPIWTLVLASLLLLRWQ